MLFEIETLKLNTGKFLKASRTVKMKSTKSIDKMHFLCLTFLSRMRTSLNQTGTYDVEIQDTTI